MIGRTVSMMADLSEYEALNDIEFSQEVKQLMELFAESWEECRSDECGACKYRHGKEMYQLLFCLSERYAEKLISNGFAQVRHGRWDDSGRYRFENGDLAIRCTGCGCSLREDEFEKFVWNYCPVCGARMEGGDKNDE